MSLAALLREVRALVGSDDDDIAREIEWLIEHVEAGDVRPAAIAGLFLPTGHLQELSLYEGWGNELVDLANRVDAALESPPALGTPPAPETCPAR